MKQADMVRMANQIATYFQSCDRDEAVGEVANHIRSFWEPRMRSALHAHVAAGGAGLDVLVVEAVRRLTDDAAA